LDWLKSFHIAHRGLHTDNEIVPENSMLAFQNAKNSGYAMEFDIHITKDNQIVVFHDKTLQRMCGVNIDVEEANFDEIKSYFLLSSDQTIPLLKDVLKEIGGAVPLLIEIKNTLRIREIGSELLRLLQDYPGDYAVQSFNPFIIRWFNQNAPQVKRGLVAYNMKDSKEKWINKLIIKHILLYRFTKPHFINYEHVSMPSSRLNALQKRGCIIIAWTVRTQSELDRVKQFYSNAVFELFIPNKK
jgi:glycerophosphoryl diester phosphodiesterase